MGKSLYALEWIAKHSFKRILILSPLVVLPQWEKFIEEHLQPRHSVTVHPIYRKLPKAIGALLEACKGQETPFILLCNYDKLKEIHGKSLSGMLKQIDELKLDAIICDESHLCKAPSTQRGKAVRYLCQSIPNVRLLTGTMAPNGVEDLWGQFACIDPETWKPNYTQFKRVHLITNEYDYGKVIGVQKPKLLERMVKAGSLTYNRDDIFGPDTWIETVREIDLDHKSRDMYDAIVKTWVLEQEEFGVDLEVTHALARMMKLRQLTSGFLSTEEGIVEVNTHKLDLVMEDLGDIIRAKEKAVIFHQFKHEGEIYYNGAGTLGVPVYRINGSTSSEERAVRVSEFTNLKGPAVFVINTHAGGIGISLASASHALFVSQSYSYAVETQARDRIYSPGKVRTVTYYRVNRSIDAYISSVLLSKTNFNNLLKQSKIRDIAYGTVTYRFEGNIK
jgi:SNF2 family DNA or RNA helicase